MNSHRFDNIQDFHEKLISIPANENTYKERLARVVYLLPLINYTKNILVNSRLIYLDLGARDYDSSIPTFVNNYPSGKEFRVIAFEADPKWNFYYNDRKNVEYYNFAVGITNKTTYLSSHTPAAKITDQITDTAVNVLDFSEWLRNNIKPQDFVVAKMDIEGMEFDLIPYLRTQQTLLLIDELFIECHHIEMWGNGPKTFTECYGMLSSLQTDGIWTHEWF